MFPLPFVVGAGLFPFDRRVVRYALPLAAVGVAVALYEQRRDAGAALRQAAR